ncbi:MAG TPA: sensor domain-containing protein [Streptosporangiaceae bacterium]|nr:sensor domain-containing protein [Streptosporangiaceae bacterium]
MAASIPDAARGRGRSGARVPGRVARRTLVESAYLLTAPATAVAGLPLMPAGLGAGAVGLLVPGGSGLVPGALAVARWPGDLERWRIAQVRWAAAGPGERRHRTGQKKTAPASGPGPWLDAAHAVAVLPVVLVTFAVTAPGPTSTSAWG